MYEYICMGIMYEYIRMSICMSMCMSMCMCIRDYGYVWVCILMYMYVCCLCLNVIGIFRSLAYTIICALLINMCRKEKLPWTMPRRRAFLISW